MAEPASTHADVADTRWGRRPGSRPPLAVWAPAVFTVLLGLLLTLVIVLVVRPPGPLDQASLADQRNGLLLDGPVLDPEVAGVAFGRAPVVLLFLRETPDAEELERWAAELPDSTRVTAVVTSEAGSASAQSVELVWDEDERLARAVDLPEPRDGGPGIGYAVVDRDRVVRYSTLDPAWADNAFEVATIVGSVP